MWRGLSDSIPPPNTPNTGIAYRFIHRDTYLPQVHLIIVHSRYAHSHNFRVNHPPHTTCLSHTTHTFKMAPIRLAVLEADTPQPNAVARYSHYTGLFTSLLSTAVSPAPVAERFTITRHHVVNDTSAYPNLEDVDAVLVTGSKHSAYMDDEWIVALVEYVRRAIEGGRVRVVGVCFGHQIVGRAMGVEVGVSEVGWEVAVTDVELSDEGKKVFGLEKMVRFPLISVLRLDTFPFHPLLTSPSSLYPLHPLLQKLTASRGSNKCTATK